MTSRVALLLVLLGVMTVRAEDPLPLIRLQVPPERVPEAMKQAGQGRLVETKRSEFERLLRDAARAGEAIRNPPRLAETHYRGTLIETRGPAGGVAEAHLSGSGHWNLTHPGEGSGLLTLPWLNVALHKPHFEDRQSALLGELDGKSLGLLVEKPGAHTVAFDWSSRGELRPEAMHFQLDLPPSPVASLELDVPVGYVVTVASEGCTRSGPHPAATDARRLWRIGFSNRAQVVLLVRRGDDAVAGTPLFASLQTRQDVLPDAVESAYEFDLKTPPAGVNELRLEHEPTLRPYEVAAPALEAWEPDGEGRLLIRLREPLQGGKVMVKCLGPLSAGTTAWVSPVLRIVGAVPRGETLTLRFSPNVRPESWQPGGYRLTATKTELDGSAVLTLVGGGVESEAGLRRPSAVLRVRGPEYTTREVIWWQADPDKSVLASQITWDVVSGRLMQMPVALPRGWDVDRVELTPTDLLRSWGMKPNRPGEARPGLATLLVELQRGLSFGEPPATLTVWLRPTRAGGGVGAGKPIAFPDVVPLGARVREGVLAVSFDEKLYEAVVSPRNRPAQSLSDLGASRDTYPWGKQVPDLVFAYRGQPTTATLTLRPLRPRVRLRCTTELLLTAGRAALAAHLQASPELGQPESLDLALSSPVPAGWTWKIREGGNSIVRAERLPAVEATPQFAGLAARSALESASLAVAANVLAFRGELWRLTLERPLTEPLTIEAGGVVPVGMDRVRLEVPLITAAEAVRMEGEVKLYLAGTNQVQVVTSGLRQPPDVRPSRTVGRAPPWRSFRYTTGPVALSLSGTFGAEAVASDSVVGPAHLTTYLQPGGGLRHEFTFTVWNWLQRVFPLRLPVGTRLLSVRLQGRWLDGLQAIPDEDGEGARLELPVAGEDYCQFEIVYAANSPAWTLWTRLDAPAPQLPIEPLGFRRSWQLPSGIAPLATAQLQPLPGPNGSGAWSEQFGREAVESVTRLLTSTSRTSLDDDSDLRREQFARAATVEAAAAMTLGEALALMVFSGPREYGPLVIDAAALRQAGIDSSTPLTRTKRGRNDTPWSSLGLVDIACPAGLLLTTRRQQSAWEAVGGTPGRAPLAVEQAAEQAVRDGHDRTGRFVIATDWVTGQDPTETEQVGSTPPLEIGVAATTWESTATTSADAGNRLTVVREAALLPVGVALALLPTLLFWRWRNRRAWRRAWLLGWLGVSGVAALWVPPTLAPLAWWPLTTALGVSLAWYLWSATRVPEPTLAVATRRSHLRPVGLLLLAGCLGLVGTAAPPEPPTVYLLPASQETPEDSAVLVPPDLLEQIRGLTRRGAAGLRGAVLLAAASEGEVGENAVAFETTFQVHVFGGEPAILTVPLEGVQLEELFLDGARAFAAPPSAPQPGFSVRLEGTGNHVLRVRFRTPLRATGDDLECRFTLPRLLQNRVVLNAPLGTSYLHLSGRLGSQKVTQDNRRVRLEAELGPATGALQFRWRQESGPPRPPEVAVQELYLWELGADAATLHGQLQYTVTHGAIPEIQLDLPEQTEVRAVEAGPKPKLKGWHVTTRGERRRLQLQFQSPVTSSVQVRLELIPRVPFRGETLLPLPAPREAHTTRGLLAFRLDGLRADITTLLRARPVVPADFSREWQDAGGAPLPAPAYACLFDRKPAAPALGLQLRLATPRLNVVQDLNWRLALTQADLRAVIRLSAPDADLALVEWEAPESVIVSRITGADVRGWNRSGSRIQVWLMRSVAQTEIQVTGWSLPAKKPDGSPTELVWDLPRVGVPAADEQTTLLRLTAVSGHVLERVKTKKLGAWPDPRPPQPSEPELQFVTRQVDYGGTFRVQPAATPADVQVLTFAEVRERRLAFVSRVTCQSSRGELRTLTFRLRRWEGGDVRLEAPDAVLRSERRDAEGRTWTLELQPGVGARYQFSLEGSVPLAEASGGLPMPEVIVADAARSEHWLAVAGSELAAEELEGVEAIPDTVGALRLWPREAERVRRAGGSVWRVVAPEGGLLLVPKRQAGGDDAVQVFLTEYESAVVDGRGWMHEATYWLRHEAGTDLNLTLPAWAWTAGVTVDGSPVTPLQRERALWLPLPGDAGVRQVRLRWTFEPGAERLDRPNLERPRVEGVGDAPVVWTLRTPFGYEATVRSNGSSDLRPADRATVDLWRAAGQLRLSAALAVLGGVSPQTRDVQLALAQHRFYLYGRRAEYALSTAASPSTALGPKGQSLSDWLRDLEEENRELSVALGFEDVRMEAQRQVQSGELEEPVQPLPGESSAFDGPLPLRGTPLRWVGKGEAVPSLQWTLIWNRQRDQALFTSVVLVVVLLAIGLLSQWSWAVSWAKAFWPEEAALLGYLGWHLAGPNVLFALLCLMGVSGRIILLIGWLAATLRRPATRRPSTLSAVPHP